MTRLSADDFTLSLSASHLSHLDRRPPIISRPEPIFFILLRGGEAHRSGTLFPSRNQPFSSVWIRA